MAHSYAFQQPLRPSDSPSSFPIDHALLNPRFESYRLVDDGTNGGSAPVSVEPLPLPSTPLSLRQSSDGRMLGYKQAKERALHSFLVPARLSSPADPARRQEPVAGYIDVNGFVILLCLTAPATGKAGGEGRTKLVGHPVHRIELDPQRGALGQPSSLPSMLSLSPTRWIVSDGSGMLFDVRIEPTEQPGGQVRWASKTTSTLTIKSDDDDVPIPFGLITAEADGDGIRVLTQSCRREVQPASTPATQRGGLGFASASAPGSSATPSGSSSKTVFDVRCILLDGGSDQDEAALPEGAQSGPEAMQSHKIAFRPRMPPHYSWAQTTDTLTVAFSLPADIAKADIRVHFSLKGISLSLADDQPRIVELSVKESEPPAGATQADDKVTDDPLQHAADLIRSGRYLSRALWGDIDPTGSVWTWERVIGHAGVLKGNPMGVLTLHLEKKHEGTRWTQVFADRRQPRPKAGGIATGRSEWEHVSKKTKLSFREARERAAKVARGETDEVGEVQAEGMDEDEMEEEEQVVEHEALRERNDEKREIEQEDDDEDDEDDVPETLDPSELINMLEGMEKYTTDEDQLEVGGAGPGIDRTQLADQPSLLRDGLEEEDDNVGRALVLSWIIEDHHDTPHGDPVDIRVDRLDRDAQEKRMLLALPMPTAEAVGSAAPEAIAVKNDLDGAVFAPPPASKGPAPWQHVDTLPALAFVLASKRDAHRVFVRHDRVGRSRALGGHLYCSAALAFESAPQIGLDAAAAAGHEVVGDAGNLFVYYSSTPAEGAERKHGKSRVIRLGGGQQASGALLGVVAVPTIGGEGDQGQGEDILCLCERSLLVVRNVL
ncbi:uncharacterized protein PFL1_03402 [Pseudozyma flocculosa PF-1]|uniref:NudC domain-containing protein 1 n=1 Tax=Pseudozyma flocculosa PF-1 TaxID=1277687 RepID=A0A061H9J0_9BASI|nr:uncharacterized protein PFL1_03402 [Pseudozyma flocculosa PF-1]EPQ29114.1 hypothetical protein PFL1_03402 [Pseudozyma flocculosa PF-1]